MDVAIPFLGERPQDVPAVTWDLVSLLRVDLEGITALATYRRQALAEEDVAAADLFAQIEARLRDEVGRLQDLLNERQMAGALPPDFALPTSEEEVVD